VLKIDLFAEDRAHEQFTPSLIQRLVEEQDLSCNVRVVSARGGHPRVAAELDAYQKVLEASGIIPDLIIVSIDANCNGFQKAKKLYEGQIVEEFRAITVIAAPDPHIERWYLADTEVVADIIGTAPHLPAVKCDHDWYKAALEAAAIDGGNTPTLGGLEFGPDIAQAMNLYRTGKIDGAFRSFVSDLRGKLKIAKQLNLGDR
jgi:hypothetical protein